MFQLVLTSRLIVEQKNAHSIQVFYCRLYGSHGMCVCVYLCLSHLRFLYVGLFGDIALNDLVK